LRRLLQDDKWITRIVNEGGRCEVKANGVTIHWRGCSANQIADIRAILFEWWQTERLHKQLLWRDFDGGVGLRVPGRDKGQAVACVLDECPGALAAYLGDDAADEDAFTAINRRGLSALVRPQWRHTAAQVWLRPPEDLLHFLDGWIAAGRPQTN
jgi:trehalose 6-phosphate phosphatase